MGALPALRRAARRALTAVLLGFLAVYRRVFSPLLPPACRFLPTCSEYAETAIRTRGPLVGGMLAFWRLVRCNPFCSGGHDPVPGVPSRERGS